MKIKVTLTPSETYFVPTAIPTRLENGTLVHPVVRLRVKRLDQDAAAAMIERYTEALDPALAARLKAAVEEGSIEAFTREMPQPTAAPTRPVEAMRRELREIVVGWDPEDLAGTIEENFFSAERFEALMGLPGATQAIFHAVIDSVPTAKQKNSPRSP